MKSKPSVIYIAGNGHSGTTMLDMMLGQSKSKFSAGELTFVARTGICDEYCSCGETIGNCPFWTRVASRWTASRPVDMVKFQELRHRYERNKSIPRVLANLLWPSKDFHDYCEATKALLSAIHEVSEADVIIDSSKSASRILILNRISDVRIVHLCRNFTGVLNSVGKPTKKNLMKGIEADIPPVAPDRALFTWVFNNSLVSLLRLAIGGQRVHYRQMVGQAAAVIEDVVGEPLTSTTAGFSADHMLAGNALRLRKNIVLDPEVGFQYQHLTGNKLRFGRLVDKMFWFWAKS